MPPVPLTQRYKSALCCVRIVSDPSVCCPIMATAAVITPHDVSTTLNYYTPIGEEAPYSYAYEPPEGKPLHNIGIDTRPAVIHDVRGQEKSVSLDTTGFQFVKHVSAEKEFEDEEAIKTTYYKEVEELLKKEAGAQRVFIFDHTIRSVPIVFDIFPGSRASMQAEAR